MKYLITLIFLIPFYAFAIIGKDDRVPVKDMSVAPFSSIGRVLGPFNFGTGSLIAPGVVLTAAHVSKSATQFQLAYDGNSGFRGNYKIREIIYPRKYIEAGCDKAILEGVNEICRYNDFAFLLLEGGTTDETTLLKLENYSESERVFEKVNAIGYGKHKFEGMKVRSVDCSAVIAFHPWDKQVGMIVVNLPDKNYRSRVTPVLLSDCDALGGDSGSPIIKDRKMVALIIRANKEKTPDWSNLGALWTSTWFSKLAYGATMAIPSQTILQEAAALGIQIPK